MEKGKINKSAISLIFPGDMVNSKLLFNTIDGIAIHDGDHVKFYNGIFPSNGTISNSNGLIITCYNQLLGRFDHYIVEENDL